MISKIKIRNKKKEREKKQGATRLSEKYLLFIHARGGPHLSLLPLNIRLSLYCFLQLTPLSFLSYLFSLSNSFDGTLFQTLQKVSKTTRPSQHNQPTNFTPKTLTSLTLSAQLFSINSLFTFNSLIPPPLLHGRCC